MSKPTPTLVYLESMVVGMPESALKEFKEKMCALPYQEYLKTPYWKLVRKCVLEQRRYRCEYCLRGGGDWMLHVHHTRYEHRGEEYRYLDDMRVLCEECHAGVHDIRNAVSMAVGREMSSAFFEEMPKRIKDVAISKRMPGGKR